MHMYMLCIWYTCVYAYTYAYAYAYVYSTCVHTFQDVSDGLEPAPACVFWIFLFPLNLPESQSIQICFALAQDVLQWQSTMESFHRQFAWNNKQQVRTNWTTISKPFAKPFGWTKPTGSWYRSITLLLFTSWCEEMTAKIGMWTATSATFLWSTKTWLFTSSANVPPDSNSEPFSFLILPIGLFVLTSTTTILSHSFRFFKSCIDTSYVFNGCHTFLQPLGIPLQFFLGVRPRALSERWLWLERLPAQRSGP